MLFSQKIQGQSDRLKYQVSSSGGKVSQNTVLYIGAVEKVEKHCSSRQKLKET